MSHSRFVVVFTMCAALAMGALPAYAAKSPGALPQTSVEPSFGAPLTRQMTLLASAFPHRSVSIGNRLFFPEAAYVKMKTGEIPDPARDWQDRLFDFFVLDIAAYRDRLYFEATTTFIRVEANPRI
ncbi:MAG: hypothetical protein ABI298_04240, partial [Acidimicrobiales bacterium]